MRLQYEIAATDNGQVRTLLRGVEREARASNKRMAADAQQTAKSAAKSVTKTARGSDPVFGPGRKEQMAQLRANERAEINSARNIDRAKQSLDKQRSRALMSQFQRDNREQERLVKARHASAERISSGVATSFKSSVGNVLKVGGAAAGIAGGFAAANALEEQMNIRRMSAHLANISGKPGSKNQIANESTQVRGFSGTETLEAMQGFVEKTGNVDAARDSIKGLGELALATGANFGELGTAAGQAFVVIRDQIQDPKKQIAALQDVMQGLAAQGHLGSVEISDMVTELAGLGAATRRFEGGPVKLIKTMAAMSELSVMRGGASTASEGTTAVMRFSDDIIRDRHKSFEKNGISRYTDSSKTKLRAPEEMMGDVLEKTGGDRDKLKKMFGLFADRAVGGLSPVFLDAEKKKKGSGRAAVMAEFARFQNATVSGKQLKERADSTMAEPDRQFKEAAKEFNTAVGKEMMPAVMQLTREAVKLVPTLAAMTRMVAKFVDFAVTNPWSGVATLIGAAMVKDFLAASIGTAVKSCLTAAITSAMPGGSVDENGNFKPGGKMSAVGTGMTVGIAIASAIITAGVVNFEKSESNMKEAGTDLNAARDAAARGDLGEVERLRKKSEGRLGDTKKDSMLQSFLEGTMDVAQGATMALVPGMFGKKPLDTHSAAQGIAGATVEGNKQTDIRTQEAMLDTLRAIEANLRAHPPGAVAPAYGQPNRTAPIISPAR